MDANNYTPIKIVSPAPGFTVPELLVEAKKGHIPDYLQVDRRVLNDLLDGLIPTPDPQSEVYRLLLVAACNYYHKTMPFLFERINDYTELLLPTDLLSRRSVLSDMLGNMPAEDCRDVEILGWLYQFYISEKKDQVFKNLSRGIKVPPQDIPAATQLFTPHWIERYLVENSLGRLWLSNFPNQWESDLESDSH